eukprot:1220716-Pleurochrysis_carterae.AAC.1
MLHPPSPLLQACNLFLTAIPAFGRPAWPARAATHFEANGGLHPQDRAQQEETAGGNARLCRGRAGEGEREWVHGGEGGAGVQAAGADRRVSVFTYMLVLCYMCVCASVRALRLLRARSRLWLSVHACVVACTLVWCVRRVRSWLAAPCRRVCCSSFSLFAGFRNSYFLSSTALLTLAPSAPTCASTLSLLLHRERIFV